MTATIPPPPGAALPSPTATDPGFSATLRSEWTKFRTARAPMRNLVLGTVLSIALSGLLALAVASTFDQWDVSEQLDFDPIVFSLSGLIIGAIFFVAVGSRVATSEYSTGMIRMTLTATPKRARVLLAKVLVVAGATWVAGLVAVAGMVAVSQLAFASYDLRTAGLFGGDTLRVVIPVVVLTPQFPILAVVAGILFRSTAPTITVVLALLFVPSMFGALLPTWWQENVFTLFPGSAADALSLGHIADSPTYLSTIPALFVVLAWLVLPLALAHTVLDRRDA